MLPIKVYTTEICPRCKQLKDVLKSQDMGFDEVNMSTAEALTELRVNGIFTTSAPVMQVGDDFFTSESIFEGAVVKTDLITSLLGKND
ncbi:MAG: glutaredoxin domain-containing protein [Halobacteriota archaeon]|nr:glutaredoxin domain-containing protein [Halobacteriota archaeon]